MKNAKQRKHTNKTAKKKHRVTQKGPRAVMPANQVFSGGGLIFLRTVYFSMDTSFIFMLEFTVERT